MFPSLVGRREREGSTTEGGGGGGWVGPLPGRQHHTAVHRTAHAGADGNQQQVRVFFCWTKFRSHNQI